MTVKTSAKIGVKGGLTHVKRQGIQKSSKEERSGSEANEKRGEKKKRYTEYRSEKKEVMKLSEYNKVYQEFSGRASDVARQLAFAGIALIWVFKIDAKPVPKVPEGLLLPSAFLAVALAADLLHYTVSTLIWGWFHRHHEKKLTQDIDDPELTASPYFNYPTLFFFWTKLGCTVIAYSLICKYIWSLWFLAKP